MSDIVVGVDGSDSSKEALQWALDEAEHRGLPVVVVHVYNTAPLYYGEMTAYADIGKVASQVRDEAEALVSGMVTEARKERTGVSITPAVIEAPSPARALLERAADAVLLVVGTRGHGGFTGLLLGSVSHQCVTHPPCPVTVVPPPR